MDAGQAVGSVRGKGSIEAQLIQETGGLFQDRFRGLPAIGLDEQSCQTGGNQGVGSGFEMDESVREAGVKVEPALAARDEAVIRAVFRGEGEELAPQIDQGAIPVVVRAAGLEKMFDFRRFLEKIFTHV